MLAHWNEEISDFPSQPISHKNKRCSIAVIETGLDDLIEFYDIILRTHLV